MKSLRYVIMCCFLSILMCGCVNYSFVDLDPNHETEGGYEILRINSDTNGIKSETDYFYQSQGFIGRYSFAENKFYRYPAENTSFEELNVEDFAVSGEWIYFINKEYEMKKLNYVTGEEELVFTNDDLSAFNDNRTVYNICLDILGGYLFLVLDNNMYAYPIEGNPKTDIVKVNSLFITDDKSGYIQEASFGSMIVARYFQIETDCYKFIYVRDDKSDQQIYYSEYPIVINVGDRIVRFQPREMYEENMFSYSFEEETERKHIKCLWGDRKYDYSDIEEGRVTVEDGEIFCVLSVTTQRMASSSYWQSAIRCDTVFRLNPETEESSILYETENNKTRIIGYKRGVVYLLEDYVVYSQRMDSDERIKLFELPQNERYIFDWQSGYLIVRYDGEDYKGQHVSNRKDVAAIYKVE